MTTPATPRPNEEPRKCPRCRGTGIIEWFNGPSRHWEVCEDCDGDGTVTDRHGEMTDDGSLPDE